VVGCSASNCADATRTWTLSTDKPRQNRLRWFSRGSAILTSEASIASEVRPWLLWPSNSVCQTTLIHGC